MIECTGFGDLGQALFEQFQTDPEPILVVILEATWQICSERAVNRDWSQIPYPPVEEAMPDTIRRLDSLFNSGTLEATWSKAPQITLLKLKNNTLTDQRESLKSLFETVRVRQPDQPLRQQSIIHLMKDVFQTIDNIQSIILIGSFGRGQGTILSDVDLQILTTPDFALNEFQNKIRQTFKSDLYKMTWLTDQQKLILYLYSDLVLVDLFICKTLSELDLYFLGSEIEDPEAALLFDRTGEVMPYLQAITQEKQAQAISQNHQKVLTFLEEFQYTLRGSISAYKKGDGYKFYFLNFILLHYIVQLRQLSLGESQFNYLPPQFIKTYLTEEEQAYFQTYCPQTDLTHALAYQRALLDFFYVTLSLLAKAYPKLKIKESEIKAFCEQIYGSTI